jgi:GNAT superfamily N-acetyltransferase
MFADTSLARRLENVEAELGAVLTEARARVSPELEACYERIAGGVAAWAGHDFPLTHALAAGMNGPVTDEEMERLEEFYRSRGTPCAIDLCPHTDWNVLAYIGVAPYQIYEFNNILARRLSSEDSLPASPLPYELRACGQEVMDAWSYTLAAGFLSQAEPPASFLDVGRTIFAASGVQPWAAWQEATLAAGGALTAIDGVGVLFADATLVSFRGRGMQRALIRARLAEAIRRGCDLAMASVIPGSTSQHNYEQAGFQVMYTRTNIVRRWSETDCD